MTTRAQGLVLVAMAAAGAGCGRAPTVAPATPVDNSVDGPSDATPLAGVYRNRHDIEYRCNDTPDGWCTQPVSDSLIVRDRSGGALYVVIDLLQTNAHSCAYAGELAPQPPAQLDAGVEAQWQVIEPPADDVVGGSGCTATLTLAENTLTLTSAGCREYCGARATLDASFPRASWREFPEADDAAADPDEGR